MRRSGRGDLVGERHVALHTRSHRGADETRALIGQHTIEMVRSDVEDAVLATRNQACPAHGLQPPGIGSDKTVGDVRLHPGVDVSRVEPAV